MNGLTTHLTGLRADHRKALVAFLTAGYPNDTAFDDLVRAADDAGCDVIEVGIPFSDPIADGPAIQAASTAALAHGVTLHTALDRIAELSDRTRAALVIMSYINPILRLGVDAFAARAAEAGVRGVILPDVSYEESGAFRPALNSRSLSYIDLVAPTSGEERIRSIARESEGFVYVVSVTGVTGARSSVSAELPALIGGVRKVTDTPVYVGFGVSTPEQAAEVARQSDGVIIGSRLMRLAGEGDAAGAGRRVGDFLATARRAIDQS